jgi:hypothetical protein
MGPFSIEGVEKRVTRKIFRPERKRNRRLAELPDCCNKWPCLAAVKHTN